MNVEPVVQPKAAPHCFLGGALRGGNGPVWMGSVERQFHRRSQRGKGGASFPQKDRFLIAEFGGRAPKMRAEMEIQADPINSLSLGT